MAVASSPSTPALSTHFSTRALGSCMQASTLPASRPHLQRTSTRRAGRQPSPPSSPAGWPAVRAAATEAATAAIEIDAAPPPTGLHGHSAAPAGSRRSQARPAARAPRLSACSPLPPPSKPSSVAAICCLCSSISLCSLSLRLALRQGKKTRPKRPRHRFPVANGLHSYDVWAHEPIGIWRAHDPVGMWRADSIQPSADRH